MRKRTLAWYISASLLLLGGTGFMNTATADTSNSEHELLESENERGTTERAANLRWNFGTNGFVPSPAIVGGWEPGRTLYICHGWHGGGLHPGKIVANNCNIGWGGKEITLNSYEVLVGDNSQVSWVDASYGGVPSGAVSGGSEPGRPNLYICRVSYRGLQPGKLVEQNCNIGYGGDELTFHNYQVLVTR